MLPEELGFACVYEAAGQSLHGLESCASSSGCVCFPQAHQCSVNILQSFLILPPSPPHKCTHTHTFANPCSHNTRMHPHMRTHRHPAHRDMHVHAETQPQSHLYTHAYM